jgi:hypothetical protein
MQLYVVVDTLGAGRVVGVFPSRDRADTLVAIEPSYYQLYECRLNEVNPIALDWARTEEQRAALRRLMDDE